MFIAILMSCVLGHILGDFIFQTNRVALGKQELNLKYILYHFLILFVTSVIVLMLKLDVIYAIKLSLIIVSIHIVIDIVKSILERKLSPKAYVSFLVDQSIHIITIVIISFLFVKGMTVREYNVDFIEWVTKLFSLKEKPFSSHILERYIETVTNFEIYASILLFLGIGSGIFVGKFLEQLKDFNIEETTFKLGRYIGIFERLIIIILAANLQFRAIGLIIAAKSLARHEKFEHQHFAEYYLLGTLLNILIGITGGLLINYMSALL